MKWKAGTVITSSALGFGAWRLFERSRLTRRFVQAGVAPADASVATAMLLPFWATSTFGDLENTIEQAAAPGMVDAEYFSMAEDARLVSQGRAIT
jgi:hypothetical protein